MGIQKIILSTIATLFIISGSFINSFGINYTTSTTGNWFSASTWTSGVQPNNNPSYSSSIISNYRTTLSNATGSTLQLNNGSNYIINAPIVDLSTSSGWSLALDNSGGSQAAINADVYFKGGFSISNPCTIAGNAYLGGTLTVANSGSASLIIKSGYSVTVSGLSVSNSLIIEPGATLIVLGNVLVANTGSAKIQLDGTLKVTGTVDVYNAISGSGTLYASPVIVENSGSASVFGSGSNKTITCPGTCTLSDPSQNPTCSGVSAAISANQTICTGATPDALNSTTTGVITSRQWQVYSGTAFASVSSGGNTSVYYPPATSSNSSYRLKISTSACTALYSNSVVMSIGSSNATPTGTGSMSGTSVACQNSNNILYSLSGVSNVTTYNWTVPSGFTIAAGGTTSTITVSISAGAANGVISVMGANGCGQSARYSFPVTVTSLPTGTGVISSQTSSICNNQNGLGFTVTGYANTTAINWTVPSGMTISSGQGTGIISVNTISVSGTILVSVAGANSCGIGTVSAQTLTMDNFKWLGTSSDWTKASNWCGGSAPGINADVIIPSGSSIYPILTVSSSIKNITISGGASLSILSNYTLSVLGNWLNNGTFSGTSATVFFNGSATQTITGTSNSDFYNLSATNSQGVVLGSSQRVKGTLTLGISTTLNSAGNLILYSDAIGTGRVATLPTGASVTGNVMVQNYMGGKLNARYLSVPVQNAAISQFQSSIWVTGIGTGFDAGSTTPTIYTYVESVSGSVNYGKTRISSTASFFATGKGYEVLVRSRSLNVAETRSKQTMQPVTLSVTGTLNQGNATIPVTYTNTGNTTADGWNLVGNPYPSQIDWDAVGAWTKTNISSSIYFIDPNSSLTSSTTLPGQAYTYIPGTGCVPAVAGCNSLIAQGQGFYVRTTGASPVLLATEAVKSGGTSRRNFREDASTVFDLIKVSINGTNGLLDETIVKLGDGLTDGFDGDDNDVLKFNNSNLNLSTKSQEGYSLVMNSTAFNSEEKVIPLVFSSSLNDTYNIQVNTASVYSHLTEVYLRENLTMVETKVTGNVNLSFIYSLGDTTAKNKYSLILRKGIAAIDTIITTKPTTVTGITAGSDSLTSVVTTSVTGATITTSGIGTTTKTVSTSGVALTTDTVATTGMVATANREINVFPNPLDNGLLKISLNGVGDGEISITIADMNGNMVFQKKYSSIGNNNSLINIDSKDISAGLYLVKIEGGEWHKYVKLLKM